MGRPSRSEVVLEAPAVGHPAHMRQPVDAPRGPRHLVSLTGLLIWTNITVLFGGLLLILDRLEDQTSADSFTQDVWGPFLVLLWSLGAVNGALLVAWSPTRRIGLGVLVGTLAAVATYVLWLLLVVLPGLAEQLG